MNKLFWFLALCLFVFPFAHSQGAEGVGNDNPTGVTGEYNGSITTGGSYDPYTGNAKRFVDDLTVTGSIGAYPLKWTRVLNSRGGTGSFGDGGGWSHNYQWALSIPRAIPTPTPTLCMPDVPAATVVYPDGREVNLAYELNPSTQIQTWFQDDAGEPFGDRLVHLGGTDYDLELKDGGRVEFRTVNGHPRVAKYIFDPYGQRTTLERDAMRRLAKITEPGGRYLSIHYHNYPAEPGFPSPVEVIDRVEAYDGPQGRRIEKVQYSYEREDPPTMFN